MRQLGGRPLIVEKRPRRVRPCLGCGKPVLSTVAERLCKGCRVHAAMLDGGVHEAAVRSALSRGRRA